jgi:ATP-dependent Clp protease ATP-binding subunit ClpA
MFERFDAESRQAIAEAMIESRSRRQSIIGTEHLLLGLLEQANGSAVQALRAAEVDITELRRRLLDLIGGDRLDAQALALLGIDLDQVRDRAESRFGAGCLDSPAAAGPKGRVAFTERAKTVLTLAVRTARQLGQSRIQGEHLLLGLLDEGGGVACQALRDDGVDLAVLRRAVAARLERKAA